MRTLACVASAVFVAVVLLVLRREPEPAAWGEVNGVITRDRPLLGARVVAQARSGEVVAEDFSGVDGEYHLRVPAGTDLEVRPRPVTRPEPPSLPVVLEKDETRTENFALPEGGTAWGSVQGATRPLRCFAIPADRYPEGSDGERPTFGQLEAAPKLSSSSSDGKGFLFEGMDPALPYRLAIDHARWMLARPVTMRAGERDILAYAVPGVSLYVEVRDLETGEPLPEFTVTLRETVHTLTAKEERERDLFGSDPLQYASAGTPGVVLTWTGTNGKLGRRVAVGSRRSSWKVSIAAAGYLEHTCDVQRILRLYLLRERAPNVTLRVYDRRLVPLEDELEACVEAADGDRCAVPVERLERGVFRATLPPGRWTMYVGNQDDYESAGNTFEVSVPARGSVGGTIIFGIGGTLVLRGGAARAARLEEVEGEQVAERFLVPAGPDGPRTITGLPPGTYRVVSGGKTLPGTIEVARGTRQEIDLPD